MGRKVQPSVWRWVSKIMSHSAVLGAPQPELPLHSIHRVEQCLVDMAVVILPCKYGVEGALQAHHLGLRGVPAHGVYAKQLETIWLVLRGVPAHGVFAMQIDATCLIHGVRYAQIQIEVLAQPRAVQYRVIIVATV